MHCSCTGDTCEKPPQESQNLPAMFERFFPSGTVSITRFEWHAEVWCSSRGDGRKVQGHQHSRNWTGKKTWAFLRLTLKRSMKVLQPVTLGPSCSLHLTNETAGTYSLVGLIFVSGMSLTGVMRDNHFTTWGGWMGFVMCSTQKFCICVLDSGAFLLSQRQTGDIWSRPVDTQQITL